MVFIIVMILAFISLVLFVNHIRCKHKMVKISYTQEYDELSNTRFSNRTYKCSKCDRIDVVDGRDDPYDKY